MLFHGVRAVLDDASEGAQQWCDPGHWITAPHLTGEAYGQGFLYGRMYRREVRDLARAEAVLAISEYTRHDVLRLSGRASALTPTFSWPRAA